MPSDTPPLPHLVIVGGGFAGLNAAHGLRRTPLRITLLDRRNHHLFQPLLYQVATAALSSPDIASPLRKILRRQRNATVLLADALRIDAAARRVELAHAALDYDFLLLATGVTHNYFGHEDWAGLAPGLKTLSDALEIRRRVLLAYERAEAETDPQRRQAWQTFAVIGAGPTGVELAGALAEIARKTLARDFHRIDPSRSRVLLVDAVERVLPAYGAASSASAARQLERLGVELCLGAPVATMDAQGLEAGGRRIAARTILWAAGVQGSPLAHSLSVPLDRMGRVLVQPDLSVPGHPELYVAGDLAALQQDGRWIPGVAPAAIQQGKHVAANVARLLAGRPTQPFRYLDKGSLATIGRSSGVAEIGRLRISGVPAWIAWLFIHIFFLIGFRNRIIVLFEWAWAYFTYQRSARIILEDPPQRHPEP
jgi:NADH:quinone reductase (non-electrogenic)